MSLFFIHGGPGFNSQPDRLILSEPLSKQGMRAVFWDEPSRLRPHGSTFRVENAYLNWLKSLRAALESASPALVVASSFGARGLIDLLRLYPDFSINQILMLGPTLNMDGVFKRMMEFSEQDLKELAPATAQRLRDCRQNSRSFWDPIMQEGLSLVWKNPKLLDHYFENKSVLSLWAGVGSDPHFAVDMESQTAVLNDMATMSLPSLRAPLTTKVTVLSGSSDPVFNEEEVAKELKTVFNHTQFIRWPGCGHFPQMEKPVEFIQLVEQLTNYPKRVT